MAEDANIVVETAVRILRDHATAAAVNAAEEGAWPAALWDALEESGLTLAWVPDEHGGAGADIADGFGVLRAAGEHAAPVPLAETLLAGLLLARAGLHAPAGPMAVAPVRPADHVALDVGVLRGAARGVPFAQRARHLVVACDGAVALVPAGACAVTPGEGLAGEPADAVAFGGARAAASAPLADAAAGLAVLGAAVRAAQMAGALGRALNLSLTHATDRVQFGRPIGGFQAVQHALAQLAGEAAAAGAAADAAAEAVAAALDAGGAGLTALLDDAVVAEVAAAKVRVGEAAGTGAAIAHQVHGAMGFTYEHALHHATRRLWQWRDEFGAEAAWSGRLGAIAARRGADGLWGFVTGVA